MYRLKQPNAYLEDVIDDYDYEALDWDDQERYEPCNEDGGDEFLKSNSLPGDENALFGLK